MGRGGGTAWRVEEEEVLRVNDAMRETAWSKREEGCEWIVAGRFKQRTTAMTLFLRMLEFEMVVVVMLVCLLMAAGSG